MSNYTPNLRLTQPISGETGWGDLINNGVTKLVESAISGIADVTLIDEDYVLSSGNGLPDEARAMFIEVGGIVTAPRSVICPNVSKLYFVRNTTAQPITFKTPTDGGIVVQAGKANALQCTGTNVLLAIDFPDGSVGVKGDTGDKGDIGDKGERGLQGEPGTGGGAAMRFKRVSWANPVGSSSTVAQAGFMLITTGTASSTTVATTNAHQMMRRVYYSQATAAVNAVAGVRNVSGQWFRGTQGSKFGGFNFLCRFGPSIGAAANATRRGFCGFRAGNVPSDVDPSTIQNILGVGCDTADTTYHIMHKDNLGAVTKVDTGISKSAADFTEVYELDMSCIPGGDVTFKFTNLTTDEVFTHTASTNLPAATALLNPQLWYSVGGTSSVIGASLMHLSIDTDY